MNSLKVNFLRYAGSKRRSLPYIIQFFPSPELITGRFVDPFLGGGVVFFTLSPNQALLSDINRELIDLYRAIRQDPYKVWEIFAAYPSTKLAYYDIRNTKVDQLDLISRAARTLYLNRTCFKGWWRYNANGQFNVGYGGQERRWAISQNHLVVVSHKLENALLQDGDFESVVDSCQAGDFIFADPPYQPGEREMSHEHYVYNQFCHNDYKRLAASLQRASVRGVQWAVTTSSHSDILTLFSGTQVIHLPKDPHKKLKASIKGSGEVLICNYIEEK